MGRGGPEDRPDRGPGRTARGQGRVQKGSKATAGELRGPGMRAKAEAGRVRRPGSRAKTTAGVREAETQGQQVNTIRQSDTSGKLTTGRKTQEEGTEKTQGGKHFKTKQETRDRKRQDKTQHRQIVT